MKQKIQYSCANRPQEQKARFVVNEGNKIIKPVNGVIRWHLANMTPDMLKHEVILAFSQAFDIIGFELWPIRFEATKKKNKAQIKIEFAQDDTFETGVLAYAYYPGSSKSGILRINEAVNWSTMHSSTATHLLTVVIHELGHVLGIGHSEVLEAIMYPNYTGSKGLHLDDINALNYLYGFERMDLTNDTITGTFIRNNVLLKWTNTTEWLKMKPGHVKEVSEKMDKSVPYIIGFIVLVLIFIIYLIAKS